MKSHITDLLFENSRVHDIFICMLRKAIIFVIVVAFFLLFPVPIEAQSTVVEPVQITVHSESPGAKIPTYFLGLSFSSKYLADKQKFYNPDNKDLASLLNNLGPGVIRISGDDQIWVDGPTSPDERSASAGTIINPYKVDGLFALAKEAGWRVIYGLDFLTYYVSGKPTDMDMAVDEAAYIAAKEGSTLLAFEIGNEPTSARYRTSDSSLDFPSLIDKYTTYLADIRARAPNAQFAGPSEFQSFPYYPLFADRYFSGFLEDAKIKGNIAIATIHMYPLSNNDAERPPEQKLTIENMLSRYTDTRTEEYIQNYAARAKAEGVPLRFDEINSASIGGRNGVTDTYAGGLWGVNLLFTMAKYGVSGVNFSGGGCGGYSAIGICGNEFHTFGLYYCMLFFHKAANGRFVPVDITTEKNLTSYATLADDGSLRVTIINKEMDLNNSVEFNINLSKPYALVSTLTLSAPTLEDTGDNITLVQVDANSENSNPPVDKNYTISVRNGSAVVVTFANTTTNP